MMVPLVLTEAAQVRVVDDALAAQKMLALFAPMDARAGVRSAADVRPVGTAILVHRMLRFPDGSMRILVQGLSRVRVRELRAAANGLDADFDLIPEEDARPPELDAVLHTVGDLFARVVDAAPGLPEELKALAAGIPQPGRAADFIASNVGLSPDERLEILGTVPPLERLRRLAAILARELEMLELSRKIQSDVRGELDKGQREFFLRQQIKAIQRELGEGDERSAALDELAGRIEAAGMPAPAKEAALKELGRLRSMPQASAEYSVALTYLDWMLALPWSPPPPPGIDLAAAQRILDEDHHDLGKVKARILEYLAVRKLKPDSKGPILCFVGPPGVGKTSVGSSIARALGRPFVRLALGGVRDEAEIRGHRRTYVGALPGRILQGLAKTRGPLPLFMLDEVDKLGNDFRGDPASALLEVLDPAQNDTFTDLYLAVPFNLRGVFFICTANMLDTVPDPLLDRMEVIELPGYTNEEKLSIARRHLLPRQISENGLDEGRLRFTDDGLRRIISDYTREAGVRGLEREIASVCRKVARDLAAGSDPHVAVGPDEVPAYLGAPRYFGERAEVADQVGIATGLAWTPAGGEILVVEVTAMPGRGGLMITGQLGDVMRESAMASLSYVRSHAAALGIPDSFFATHELHLHVPSGAIPKDGPSAGVAMTTALASLASGRSARHEVAMTGEVTLRGRVLPVGGLRQKLHAAHRAGIAEVVLPAANVKDLDELPPELRSGMRFHPVSTLDAALALTLLPGRAAPRRAPARRGPVRPKAAARGRAVGSAHPRAGDAPATSRRATGGGPRERRHGRTRRP
ncbi:MAG: endopeptidase La [Candidatus Eisenbacteria bacterium]|nr:endopeptidase La [Candidatus Eisenbacteria bacterium]